MPVSFPGLGIDIFVNPIAFSVDGFYVRWYGLLIAISFCCGLVYAMRNASRYGLNTDDVLEVTLVGTICGFIGARLYYVIFAWEFFQDNPLKIFDMSTGGLAIYGGIIAGAISGCIVAKKCKASIPACLDLFAFAMLISHSIGRWGNFANQEAFGSATNLPWGMVSANTGNIAVHPCFLYESLWCVLGFVIAHFVLKKRAQYRGQIFLFYMIWYGAGRSVIEGLRSDSLYLPFSVFGYTPRVSQILSIAIVIAGVVGLFLFRERCDLPIICENTLTSPKQKTKGNQNGNKKKKKK